MRIEDGLSRKASMAGGPKAREREGGNEADEVVRDDMM